MDETAITENEILNKFSLLKKYIWKKMPSIVALATVGALLGICYYFFQKPNYSAESTFIVEEKQNNLGALSGLASQFGFELGGLTGGGGIFSGDNILDILKSKKILSGVLLSKLDTIKKTGPSLADRYMVIAKKKKKWKNTELSKVNFTNLTGSLNRRQDSALNLILSELLKGKIITERINRKGSIIKLTVNSSDAYFAIELNRRLIKSAVELYTHIKTGTAQENIDRLQKRSDSLLMLLNSKTYSAAAIQVLDGNPGVKTALAPVEIAMRNKTVVSMVYSEVTKNLEASKVILSQQLPVIQLLDEPGQTLYDNKKSKIVLSVIFAAFLTMGGIVWHLTFFYLKERSNLNENVA